jgi:signal transduction histidine kinase
MWPPIQLDLQIEPALPALACGRISLQSVIMNLLTNGRDATPNGGRTFDLFSNTKMTGLGGIGLPMVRRLLRRREGAWTSKSQPNFGTRVNLCFPVAAAERSQI